MYDVTRDDLGDDAYTHIIAAPIGRRAGERIVNGFLRYQGAGCLLSASGQLFAGRVLAHYSTHYVLYHEERAGTARAARHPRSSASTAVQCHRLSIGSANLITASS